MLQSSSKRTSGRFFQFYTPISVSRRSDLTQYQVNLENPSVEQILESTVVIDWQAQTKLNDLQDQVNVLQNQVMVLVQDIQNMRQLLREADQGAVGLAKTKLNIEWDHVRSVVEAATFELNWDVQISIDTSENLVLISVKEEQDDLIAETTFDFYTFVIAQLGQEVFNELDFYYLSDSDE